MSATLSDSEKIIRNVQLSFIHTPEGQGTLSLDPFFLFTHLSAEIAKIRECAAHAHALLQSAVNRGSQTPWCVGSIENMCVRESNRTSNACCAYFLFIYIYILSCIDSLRFRELDGEKRVGEPNENRFANSLLCNCRSKESH